MPQDTTNIMLYDSNGNIVTGDSIRDEVRAAIDTSLFPVQVKPYHEMNYNDGKDDTFMPFVFLFAFIFLVGLAARRGKFKDSDTDDDNGYVPDNYRPTVLNYVGSELKFSDEELEKVLNKYFPYYTTRDNNGKQKFLNRLKNFINEKTFVIHDESGFKEMPILISASAVQISFGLDKYLLPFFSHIHIFPEEFIGYHPTLRLLEGNVSGHSVNLSWKHFMNGYKFPENGQNVGLHEFAHAFYYQYFDAQENVEKDFVERFPLFNACGNRAFQQEQLPGNDLYSDYALTNFQEFWAESIEVFFERPADMKQKYADLYESICEILNQNPLNKNWPIV